MSRRNIKTQVGKECSLPRAGAGPAVPSGEESRVCSSRLHGKMAGGIKIKKLPIFRFDKIKQREYTKQKKKKSIHNWNLRFPQKPSSANVLAPWWSRSSEAAWLRSATPPCTPHGLTAPLALPPLSISSFVLFCNYCRGGTRDLLILRPTS